jgi:cystathionine gamma-synthase
VTKVLYPGLPEHPGHEIMKKQSRGFGSMITFKVDTKEHALKILENVRMIKYAESLGGVETLITYPTTQTHADVPEETRLKNGITPTTLRLSVGIEDIEDLKAELKNVLNYND